LVEVVDVRQVEPTARLIRAAFESADVAVIERLAKRNAVAEPRWRARAAPFCGGATISR
jgi:hypothetical protein